VYGSPNHAPLGDILTDFPSASADRRPVDPPPVVELRIFEVQGELKKDITFSYNANFFLFATLETARPIAPGRGQPPAQIPVLTGMPVSGMAYLDRPSEAGYFIFPDLSVRHEGKYKLSFNLYEETKDSKDNDAEHSGENSPKAPNGMAPNGSFDWRLEVKSAAFTVFSAKKFPGLAESTVLSRTVAEQGCRVRIRRDVRMRRRDGKATDEYPEYDEERARQSATPVESVHDSYRQRSSSNVSVERQPYQERRPSGIEHPPQGYPVGYAPSPIAPPPSESSRFLSFGQSGSGQYPAPQFSQPPAQPAQAQQTYPSSNAPAGYYQPNAYRQPNQPTSYGYQERQPYSQYPTPTRDNYDAEYRRPSVQYPPPPAQAASQYPAPEQNYNRGPAYTQYPQREAPVNHASVNLAPLKMTAIEPKYESHSSPVGPLSASSRLGAPLPSPSYPERSNSYNYPSSNSNPPAADIARGGKRPYDSVFGSSSYSQPLHNGMRPSSSTLDDEDDNVSMEALTMQYKRADGTSYSRELPTLE
jgi:hypothetical protein